MKKYKKVGILLNNGRDINNLSSLQCLDEMNIDYKIVEDFSILSDDFVGDCLILSFLDYYRVFTKFTSIFISTDKVVIDKDRDVIVSERLYYPYRYIDVYNPDGPKISINDKLVLVNNIPKHMFEFYFGVSRYNIEFLNELITCCDRGLFCFNSDLEDYIQNYVGNWKYC